MRLIDADAVAEAIRDEIVEAYGIDAAPDFTAGLRLGLAYVNTAETVDAVLAVRCSECKRRGYCLRSVVMHAAESEYDTFFRDVEFCSCGGREDDE